MATRPPKVGPRGVPHVAKTPGERRSYIEEVVQGSDQSPTVGTGLGPEGAGTDSPLTQRDEIERRPTRRRNIRKPGWLERNRDDLILWGLTALVGGGILTALGFAYTHNREIGELKGLVNFQTERIEDLRGRMKSAEERFDNLQEEVRRALPVAKDARKK